MAPPASHITVNPYQEVHLPHSTHMTPLYLGENRAQHKTQTGGRPLQPCWLPVSLLLPAYSFPKSQPHVVYRLPGKSAPASQEALPCSHGSQEACPASLPRPRSPPPGCDQLVAGSWRRLQAGQWTRPPGEGKHLCCRQTPANTQTRAQPGPQGPTPTP